MIAHSEKKNIRKINTNKKIQDVQKEEVRQKRKKNERGEEW